MKTQSLRTSCAVLAIVALLPNVAPVAVGFALGPRINAAGRLSDMTGTLLARAATERRPSGPAARAAPPLVSSDVLGMTVESAKMIAILALIALLGLVTWQAQAMQLGRDGGNSQGMVSNAGDYTMMTFSVGNEDMLITLDNRSEELYVYRVENQNAVQLFQKLNLPKLFNEARTRAQGSSK